METVAEDDRPNVLSDYRPAALTSVAKSSFVRLVNAELFFFFFF